MTRDEAKALLNEALAYNHPYTTKRINSLLADPAWFTSLSEFSDQTRNSIFELTKEVCETDLTPLIKTTVWIIPDLTTGCFVHRSGSDASIVVNEGTLQCLCFLVSFFVAQIAVMEMSGDPRFLCRGSKNHEGIPEAGNNPCICR